MTPDERNAQLIAYLYGELDEHERQEMEAFLATNGEARRSLEELRRTRGVLGAWEDETPPFGLTFVPEDAAAGARRPVAWWWASGLGVAIAAVLVLAFLRIDVTMSGGTMTVRMNWAEDTPVTASSDSVLTENRFVRYQEAYLELTQDLIEASELRQRAAMIEFARVLEARWEEDLRQIGQGVRNVGQIAERSYLQSGVLLTRWAQTRPSRRK